MRQYCFAAAIAAAAVSLASLITASAQVTQPAKPEEFAPVQEVQSAFFDRKDPSAFIDLDTGKPVEQAPTDIIPKTDELRKSGADFYASGMLSSSFMRVAFELIAIPVAPEEWDKATAASIITRVSWAIPHAGQILGSGRETTYFFKTNRGTMGIFQMTTNAGGEKLPIRIKRIPDETAKVLLTQVPSIDYSSPEALIKTWVHALELNDRDILQTCLWTGPGEEKQAAARSAAESASLRLLNSAKSRLGNEGFQAFEPLLLTPDTAGLLQVKWIVSGDTAHAERESPATKDLELHQSNNRWLIHFMTPPTAAETARLESLAKAADATANRIAFENPYNTPAQAVAAFQSNLANAKAMAQRLGREGGR